MGGAQQLVYEIARLDFHRNPQIMQFRVRIKNGFIKKKAYKNMEDES